MAVMFCNKVDEDLCVLGRHELDWYPVVGKKHSTKTYKIAKRNFYYCTKRKCILPRRSLISLESIGIKHGAGIGQHDIQRVETEFVVKLTSTYSTELTNFISNDLGHI